jgi:hypothetical protein
MSGVKAQIVTNSEWQSHLNRAGSYTCNNSICEAQFSALGVRQQYPSDFDKCLQASIDKGDIDLAYKISPAYRESR